MRLSEFDPAAIKGLLAELESEATKFVRSCDAEATIKAEFKIYMRYVGQGWEIPIVLTAEQAMNPNAETFKRLFEEDYASLFGRSVENLDVEIIVWAVNATTPSEVVERTASADGETDAEQTGARLLFDPARGETVEAKVIHRAAMTPGAMVAGPGVITEDETTIILPSSRRAVAQPDGCIDVIKRI